MTFISCLVLRPTQQSSGSDKPDRQPESDWPNSCLKRVAVFVLFLSAVLSFQAIGGSWKSEFGGYPDESAHYVTGVMFHDYLVSGFRTNPLSFARTYYLHYPKVAIGHWPPVFYVLEALWTLVFPVSRVSLMIFIALISTLLAYSVYTFLQPDYGHTLSIVSGLILVGLPLIQRYSAMVMADTTVALFCFLASVSFARFLKADHLKDSVGFGIFAGLAILTKGTAFALALLPPFAISLTRRPRLVATFRFWLPALIVSALCIPWYWFTRGMLQSTWVEGYPRFEYAFEAFRFYGRSITLTLGLGLVVLSALGVTYAGVIPIFRGNADPKWVTLLALMVAFGLIACLVPAGLDSRFVIPLLPALVAFLAPGSKFIASRFFASWEKQVVWVLPSILFVTSGFGIPRYESSFGYGKAAEFFVTTCLPNQPILVVSDPDGEGMMVSEVALIDHRPSHFVLRASKILADENWTGSEYRLLYGTPEQLMKFLIATPIALVLDDESVPPKELRDHQQLLRKTIETYPTRWKLVKEFPIVREGARFEHGLRVYSLFNSSNAQNAPIEMNLQRMIGETLKLQP